MPCWIKLNFLLKNALFLQNDKVRRNLWFVWFRSNWTVKRSCTYTYIYMWLVYLHSWGKLFCFVLVHYSKLLKWWIISYKLSGIYLFIEPSYLVILSWRDWKYLYVIGEYICCMHISCWWIHMLCAYKLLVNIYVVCI